MKLGIPSSVLGQDTETIQWFQKLIGVISDMGNGQNVITLPVYANNAAALAGNLKAGMQYRTGGDPDLICIVH